MVRRRLHRIDNGFLNLGLMLGLLGAAFVNQHDIDRRQHRDCAQQNQIGAHFSRTGALVMLRKYTLPIYTAHMYAR